ncbi:hypothetical protein OXX80_010266 [Metschnikowia pulcherrima]
MSRDLSFLDELSPTQEHFLKKFLVEACLRQELQYLSKPHCLEYIGPPFRAGKQGLAAELPLLRFFFQNFIASFPFITMNAKTDQIAFWRDTVQPFVESFNTKRVSGSASRRESVTKRHQVNRQLLRTLLLFYNSMLSSKRELEYLNSDHLKPSDQGKLDKISKTPNSVKMALDAFQTPSGLDDYAQMAYTNNYNVNIVAVDVFAKKPPQASSTWSLNPLRLVSQAKPGGSQYSCVFILQVTKRTIRDGKYTYKSHFIARKYKEWRHLERALKQKFPGLMSAEIHAMPAKIKHDSGVRNNTTGNDGSMSNDSLASPTTSASGSTQGMGMYANGNFSAGSVDSGRPRDSTYKYYGEKLRLALRGYTNTLLHKVEIASSKAFLEFIDDPSKNFDALSSEQMQDYEQRMELEKVRLATQEEFQTHIAKIVYELSGNFETFKKELLTDPHQLSAIFEEIGRSPNSREMSPLVTSFIEWCKLEIAATLYQMFLTQDNSSQWLQKCRKFHRVFPYRMCYTILKYTNPVKIMSRMVDLLLMNVPSFGRKSGQANNLLSMIFIMMLDDDLSDFSKEREKLLATKPLDSPEFEVFFERIRAYVHAGDASLQEDIQEEQIAKDENYFLSVLSSDLIEPKLSAPERAIFERVIRPSYKSYENLNNGESVEGASIYVTLRQYWQLEIRTRDKEIFKQLWKEPELTQLIKKVLTVFYQPLMTVMKKCNVHLVFLDFQNFLDDLLAELTTLDEGDMYFTSSVEMFNRFKKLLDKYEGTFYRFLHDLYNKDEGKLFMKLIAWIESFLVALRTKFTDPEKVQLDFSAMVPTEEVDADKLREDLNARVQLILKKRFLLKSCMQSAAGASAGAHTKADAGALGVSTENGQILSSHQKAIDNQWEKLNNGIFDMQPQELGLSGEDLEEFNLTHIGEKAADAYRNGRGNAQVLRQIAELDRQMNEVSDTHIHKLIAPMHAQIKKVMGAFAAQQGK